MNSPAVEIRYDIPALFIVAFVIGVLLFAVARRPNKAVLSKWSMLGVFFVIAVVFVFGTKKFREGEHVTSSLEHATVHRVELGEELSRPNPPQETDKGSSREVPNSAETTSATTTLPDWARATAAPTSDRQVIASGRFATKEEAELQAFDLAAQAAGRVFRKFDPRGLGRMSAAQTELVKQRAIKQRFDEELEHDFGKFQAKMHQTWLQLEFSSALGDEVAQVWRSETVDERLSFLGQVAVWMTAAAALATFSLRLDATRRSRQ